MKLKEGLCGANCELYLLPKCVPNKSILLFECKQTSRRIEGCIRYGNHQFECFPFLPASEFAFRVCTVLKMWYILDVPLAAPHSTTVPL